MQHTQIYLNLLNEPINYTINPFNNVNDGSVLLTLNNVSYFCSIDLSPGPGNLMVNFRKTNSPHTDQQVLISRSIDRFLRPFLHKIDHSISINIAQLTEKDGKNTLLCCSLCAIIGLKTLFPIDIGISYLNSSDFSTSIDHVNDNQQSLFIAGYKSKIYSIEYNGIPQPGTNIHLYLKRGLQYCNEIQQQLQHIKSKYKFIDLNQDEWRINESALRAKQITSPSFNDVRPISVTSTPLCSFTRGGTVCVAIPFFSKDQTFYLQYGFYQSSCKSQNKPSKRRSIGHEDMINKVVRRYHVINQKLPMKICCEIISSDGSSSMASICATSAMLRTVGIDSRISGITIGLFKDGTTYRLKPDLSAQEDQYSEMDFKITATDTGVIGIYMDTKSYLPTSQLLKAIKLGYSINQKIIKIINGVTPTKELIRMNNIGYLVGKNGHTIKTIQQYTNSQFNVIGEFLMIETNNHPNLKDLLHTYSKNTFIPNEKLYFIIINNVVFLPHISKVNAPTDIENGIYQLNVKSYTNQQLILSKI